MSKFCQDINYADVINQIFTDVASACKVTYVPSISSVTEVRAWTSGYIVDENWYRILSTYSNYNIISVTSDPNNYTKAWGYLVGQDHAASPEVPPVHPFNKSGARYHEQVDLVNPESIDSLRSYIQKYIALKNIYMKCPTRSHFEEHVMRLKLISERELIPGGLAKGKQDSDFDAKALAKGIKVEMEHTSDENVAKEIAKDHLTEDPEYYDKLAKMEESKGLFHNINKRRKKGISREKSDSTIDAKTYKIMGTW